MPQDTNQHLRIVVPTTSWSGQFGPPSQGAETAPVQSQACAANPSSGTPLHAHLPVPQASAEGLTARFPWMMKIPFIALCILLLSLLLISAAFAAPTAICPTTSSALEFAMTTDSLPVLKLSFIDTQAQQSILADRHVEENDKEEETVKVEVSELPPAAGVTSVKEPPPEEAQATPHQRTLDEASSRANFVAAAEAAGLLGVIVFGPWGVSGVRNYLRKHAEERLGAQAVTDKAGDSAEPTDGSNLAIDAPTVTVLPLADLAYIAPADLLTALKRAHPDRITPIAGNLHALTCVAGARDHNEDYACSFSLPQGADVAPLQCVLVADGCGGHKGGRDASYLAVRHAAESLLANTGLAPVAQLTKAFTSASDALRRIGTEFWGPRDLRTTLIILLATKEHYHLGWIGDGGAVVHRANGDWDVMLTPHKGEAQNLLLASLGPTQDGEPTFVCVSRQPGDRLFMGSDGVFDVIEEPTQFWAWFESTVAEGHAPQTQMDALMEAAGKDKHFDDNLTVAYLHTPNLAPLALRYLDGRKTQPQTSRPAFI